MYSLVYVNGITGNPTYMIILGIYETREQAIDARIMVGELIIDENKKVLSNDDWLLEWEKNPHAYANQMRGKDLSHLPIKRRA